MRRPDTAHQKIVHQAVKREIIRTQDGSTTIRLPEWDECYHSKHGAIQEAYHVFIQNGLSFFKDGPVSILEIGFGTGLNAFITYLESKKRGQQVAYAGVEAYPVPAAEVAQLNYVAQLNADHERAVFEAMHDCPWEARYVLAPHFALAKRRQFFDQIDDQGKFDLVYFDAFGYRVQPELWSADIFRRMYDALKPKGVLVTYAARGVIRRNMETCGFRVEKRPGPPGKRELMVAIKE
jgi:tRNA U34 5-methylaminomethyl-2-thiouridine-forming methyltransferase MnmC